MSTDEEIEAGAAGMYGKNWNSEDPQKRPGEAMKNIWRKYVKDCLDGIHGMYEKKGIKLVQEITPDNLHGES